jgi:hypothetical protein
MSNIKGLKAFIKNNQERILFVFIIIFVAIISFRAGEVKEQEQKSTDLKVFLNNEIEKSSEEKTAIALGKAIQRKGLVKEIDVSSNNNSLEKDCLFVGSKNSDKYHIMSCRWASQIKAENRVCFKSVEDAQKQGYKPASCNK